MKQTHTIDPMVEEGVGSVYERERKGTTMPSVSPKQAKFMRAVAHGMKPQNGKGPSVAVAKDFMHADERKRKGARSKEQRSDRKRDMNTWAEGK
jgi:hypothetical protein